MKSSSVWYGNIDIFPFASIKAGDYGTWKLTYTVGRYGLDNGGRFRLLFRHCTNMGTPQTTNPSADNYVTATTSNPNAKVEISYAKKGGWRPWLKSLTFEVKNEPLAEGEQIYITIGDIQGGSKGQQIQSFVESEFKWMSEVECFETGTWVGLQNCPVTPIIAATPHRMVSLSRSTGMIDQSTYLIIKCEDTYGNPSTSYKGQVSISLQTIEGKEVNDVSPDIWEGPESYQFISQDKGCCRLKGFKIKKPGLYRFKIVGNNVPLGNTFSNIISIYPSNQKSDHYWGDLHAQYNNALGAGSVEEAFRYARDAGGVDFTGHQPNDFQFGQEGWEEVKQALPKYHVPHQFVPFLGYEWSGITTAGGDRNVHYLYDDGPLHRTSHWHIPDKSDAHMDRYPLNKLYETFRGRKDVLMVPHVGGRRCDISRYYDPELEPVIEICSVHGRFEWLLHESLENGYTVGVIGGSDDHSGRPGAAYPTKTDFGTRGGLAGIYAKELTRAGIFEALRARHTYATTGERIWLYVSTEDKKMMGDAWEGTISPTIQIRAAGTKPIEKVEILRNTEVVYSHPIFEKDDYSSEYVRMEWGGARVKGRGRHADWSGNIRVENGTIHQAKTFAFDHPNQGITSQDHNHVTWISTTSGDHDGIILHLDGTDDTAITFDTNIVKETFLLRDLVQNPISKEYGGVNLYVKASLQPKFSGPLTVDITWKDITPLVGRNAYWIRLVQEDGEMAWSSPLYFQYHE